MTPLLLGLVVSATATWVSIPVLRRARLLDVPNHRSSHVVVTPRGGGIAVWLGILAAAAWAGAWMHSWPLVVAATGLGAVGLVDDLRTLPTRWRLVAQLVGAGVVVLWCVLTGPASITVPTFAGLSVVGFVAYVNAFNFMDGINTMAGLNGLLVGAWFWWLGDRIDIGVLVPLAAGLAGAAVGFLPWNARGRLFLGDVGSYSIGGLVAGMAVLAWSRGATGVLATAPLLVYLADTGWALLTRIVRREPLGQAHRQHVYQRLVDGGWTHLAAASWCTASAVVVCLVVALTRERGQVLGLALVAACIVVYLVSPYALRQRSRVTT